MCVGASVGMLSAGLTTPLDVVKSRQMVGTATGQSVSHVIKSVIAEGGVAGLFSGTSLPVFVTVSAIACHMSCVASSCASGLSLWYPRRIAAPPIPCHACAVLRSLAK